MIAVPFQRFVLSAPVLLAAILSPFALKADCYSERIDLRGDWGQARFTISVADEPHERQRGLMFVEEMATSSGMLFVFDRPQTASFWMKNTLIPLDMLFITPEGIVQKIHENAIPGDLTGISGGSGILYVLEINGGLSKRLGIAEGSQVKHPAIDPNIASWACK